jgi:hypothetical protein
LIAEPIVSHRPIQEWLAMEQSPMADTNGSGNGKDPVSGRFVEGHRLSVGHRGVNATARRIAELRRMLVECTTEEQIKAAFHRLYELGMDGDVAALKLFLEYTCGRPPQGIEVSVTPSPDQIVFQRIDNPRDAQLPLVVGDDGRLLDGDDGERP